MKMFKLIGFVCLTGESLWMRTGCSVLLCCLQNATVCGCVCVEESADGTGAEPRPALLTGLPATEPTVSTSAAAC